MTVVPDRRERTSPSVAIIATYFGNWPIWFPAFLLSCSRNPGFTWLLFNDCPPPSRLPPNVRGIPLNMKGLNELASRKLGFTVQKRLYSQCDLRPAYGLIFEDYLEGFDFWGHCDLDVIWGDLSHFLTPEILGESDIVSSRKLHIAGHLSLWRNQERVNSLYRECPRWTEVLGSADHFRFDEDAISDYLREKQPVRLHWPERKVVDYTDLEARPYGWKWVDGKLWGPDGLEAIYLHFMTWKRYLHRIDFGYEDSPTEFIVRRRGIWSAPPPWKEVMLATIGFDRWFSRAIDLKRWLEKHYFRLRGARARSSHEASKRRQW